jgi:small-conductance mechanosensitive channel
MSFPALESLLTWQVALYLVVVVGAQVALFGFRRRRTHAVAVRRRAAGLGDDVLVDHAVRLETIQKQASVDAIVLIATVVVFPILLVQVSPPAQSAGLAVVFLGLLIWVLVSATDVARAFLGGVAFRAFVGFRQPFQVGDRVTLLGHGGKVEDIGPLFVRLNTPNDDQVNIPTAALWSAPLISANAGDRASLCVMTFHLAPFLGAKKRKQAEDAIWNAIQRSVYWDFDKPMQIYVEQCKDEIVLTAKAYVALTYNEPIFKSDVYQAFLDFADIESIPLASAEWRRHIANVGFN